MILTAGVLSIYTRFSDRQTDDRRHIMTIVERCNCNGRLKSVFLVTVRKYLRSLLSDHQEVNSTQLVQQWRTLAGRVYYVDSAVHPAGDGVLRVVADDQ